MRLDAVVCQVGTLVGHDCGAVPEPSWARLACDDARSTAEQAFAHLHANMLNESGAPPPGAYEALFVTPTHKLFPLVPLVSA